MSSTPLLQTDEPQSAVDDQEQVPISEQQIITSAQLWGLYISHFLSTWNARGYEFAAILFTASAYPDTLTASSIRGIFTTLATLSFSSAVGRWVDNNPSRLEALRVSIFFQRTAVIAACIGWMFIVGSDDVSRGGVPGGLNATFDSGHGNEIRKKIVFAVVLLLGIGERLSAVQNMMVMERDWVPTIATPGSTPSLLSLNASMRRIDLTCKLMAPVFISFLTVATSSVRTTAACIGAINAISVGVEWIAAYRVYTSCPSLRAAKPLPPVPTPAAVGGNRALQAFRSWSQGLHLFFDSSVHIPSLSLALLYFSVLSFAASMLTFLLNSGFSLTMVTVARTFSTLVEVSATVVAPWGVQRMEASMARKYSRVNSDPEGDSEVENADAAAVERMGLWGLWWQFGNLVPVTLLLFSLDPSNPFKSVALFVFLAFSRLGLWVFDLSAQTLVQTHVPSSVRSEYSGIEMGFISAAELGQWVITGIWSDMGEFKWLAVAGTAAVGVSLGAYMVWLRGRRGHLVHWEKLSCRERG